MKKNLVFLLVAALLAVTVGPLAAVAEVESLTQNAPEIQAFYDATGADYALDVTNKMTSFITNEDLGFRTAGSEAELAAGDYLAEEMQAMGLKNVTKDEVTVDTWVFKNADLTYTVDGVSETIELAAYHTTCVAENEELELVYAGKGTDADYENLDVDGKLVLVDIDQYNEWWINWPAYQAKLKGAKAILAVNVDGYCTYSEETVGVQDFCGPEDAPAFSLSVAQANPLKAAIEQAGGSLPVVFNADSVVSRDGTSYNIIGEIPGATDEVIYLVAHYDSYFRAFGDNTSGVGTVMGIMKALSESGYQPKKTFRVVLHCAEEWGVADSRYDWARGATASAEKHPEWAENAFMLLNIDGGAIHGNAEGYRLTTPYEMAEGVLKVGQSIEGSPLSGEVKINSPIWTWTEEFAYSQMGIPTIASGMYGYDNTGFYHSSSDLMESNQYDADVALFSQKFYGALMIAFDRMDVRPLRFSALFDALKETIDPGVIEDDALIQAIDGARAAAEKLDAKVVKSDEASAFNQAVNRLSKVIQNNLYTLNWDEEYQFVHNYKQTNVMTLRDAIRALNEGDIAYALDECLWAIDMNWYAYSFDRETVDYFVNQVLSPDARNSWGEGYVKTNADLWSVIRSLMEKGEGDDVSEEIAALEAELAQQEADLKAVVGQEIEDLGEIAGMMEELAS